MTCTRDTQVSIIRLVHGYGTSQITTSHMIIIIITWMLDTPLSHLHPSLLHMLTTRVYTYVLFPSSCHMNHRAYYMYYCFHDNPVFLLYACFPWLILLCPLLDIVSCYWYGYPRYWTWELLVCDMWNPTSIVPVSRYIVLVILFPLYCSRFPLYCLCYQPSSCPVITLPVSCTAIVLVTLYT